MASRSPQWRQARCVLCTAPLLVRDDNEQVVCTACGARLEVLPSPTETRVRHIGEALDSVRDTLDMAAVERALARLRERKQPQSEGLAEPLASARFRRATVVLGVVAIVLGVIVMTTGPGGYGVVLFLGGIFLVLGALCMRGGMGWSMHETQQRQREREALRIQQALAREIAHRERLLADAEATASSSRR